MFQVNDTILYGTQGVCKISEIVKRDFGGSGEADYYVLVPVYQTGSTIFVPVNSEKLTARMRRVMSVDEINELIKNIDSEKVLWIEDDVARKQSFQEIVASGDRRKLAALIRTLFLEQQRRKQAGKKLHLADEQIFKRAESLLYDELALVLKIKPDQVVPFITEHIGIEELDPKK